MFINLSRIIKYGILGFLRNGWLSMATISVMFLALLVFEGLIVFNIFTNTALDVLRDKIDISVYFKIKTSEDEILKIKKSLETLAEVKKIDYLSRDKALELFKERHAKDKDSVVSRSLEELEANPLSASLNVKANDPGQYEIIASYLDESPFKESFKEVTYAQNALVIERLNKIINTTKKGGLIFMIFLALIAVLVTFNTIRLAIYSNREEIGIMRLVGASNWFTRGPYMVEGVIYGFVSAILSLIIILPAIYFISPYLKILIPELDMWNYFISNGFVFMGYQFLFGIVLGVVSSGIAVRKHLRV